jgi:hypothetical protein
MTTPSPKLSIVIPTLNRSDLVRRAIESALAQTVDEIEIIVSNNGSTDNTQTILEQFDDSRLKIINHEMTMDACTHGNYLLSKVKGELFLGLSDDDYLEPDFAKRVISIFEERREILFAYTGCDIHYLDITVPAKLGPKFESGTDFLAAFLAGKRDVCWCACVSRTAELRSIGNIPLGTICGDMFYWTKFAARGPVGCIQQTLSHYIAYRSNGDNSSTGTTVLDWAMEVNNLTSQMVKTCLERIRLPCRAKEIAKLGKEFLSRSTADQFVWNALRGTSRLNLLVALPSALPYLKFNSLTIWIRIAAALFAPRKLLLSRVLKTAAKKAKVIQAIRAG